jgi:type IV fimbrial biogenesis protein FimT
VLGGRANSVSGFTLLELLVTVGVFAILVALGVPTMKTWVYNNRVRAVADSLQNGLRLAQVESLRRSRQVVFSLTNSPTQAGVTAAANGMYWSINVVPFLTSDSASTADFVKSGILSATTSSASTPVLVTGGPTEVCFNSLGRLVINLATGVPGGSCNALPTVPPPSGGAPVFTYNISMVGADHPLDVEVGLGGQVRMCDPNVLLSSANPQGC